MNYSLAQQYRDAMCALMALQVLQRALPLRPGTYSAPATASFRLGARELEPLARFRQWLEDSLVALIDSQRPDWGTAFLIGMARLIVVDRSLRSGSLVFLNTFQPDDAVIAPAVLRSFEDRMRAQLADVSAEFSQARAGLSASAGITEGQYSRLEHWGNRYLELRSGLEQQRAIRIHSGRLLPAAPATRSDLIAPQLGRSALERLLVELSEFERAYSERLTEQYRYNLLSRNCVSELFGSIHEALASHVRAKLGASAGTGQVEAESVARLGGYIGAGGIYFIPFVSALVVDETYDVVATEVWLSYRQEQLRRAQNRDDSLLVYLRESNVISSTLYRRNPDDSFFVFFTDDAVLSRPLFGAVNSVAGLAKSLVGLVLVPLDGGRVLRSGARGLLFSLPELLFFNIRKGSYRYLPYSWAANSR
jgi:hypothetical protein